MAGPRHRGYLENGVKLDVNWLAGQGFIRPGAARAQHASLKERAS